MKINLTISERLNAINFLNGFKGTLEDGANIGEDLKTGKTLPFNEKEAKDLNFKQDKSQITWNMKKGEEKKEAEVELCKTSTDYLLKIIEEKDKAGEFTLADSSVLQLRDKLKK